MKLIKWILIFTFAFVVSFLLLRTFSQEVFKATASAHIFGYTTPEIPIYYYIAGAFGIGLGLGILIAFYNFITSRLELHAKTKQIRDLEHECETLRTQQPAPEKENLLTAPSSRNDEYADYYETSEDTSPTDSAPKDDATDSFIG